MNTCRTMNADDVRQMIREWVGDRSLREAGQEIGVGASWLCQMLSGHRYPCGKVLDVIGVERHRRMQYLHLPPSARAFTMARKDSETRHD